MTTANLTTYNEAMKTFYLPEFQSALNHDNVLSDLIETNERDVYGKEAKFAVSYGRSGGTGARADGGALPTAEYQKTKQVTLPMKYQYGRVQFSGPTIAATRSNAGAYAQVMDNELTGIVRDLMKEVNRQLWGCGYGILARWRSTGSGTSYTLGGTYIPTAGGAAFGSAFGGKYLKENGHAVPVVLTVASSAITTATVDATDIAVSAVADTVGAENYSTITCTDPSVTEAAGTFYVRPASLLTYASGSSTTTGGARLEMMGLRGIVTNEDLDEIALRDGTNTSPHTDPLQGLDADTYSWWQAQVNSVSGGRYSATRDLTYELMQKMFDDIEIAAGKDVGPDMIMTTHAIRRQYYAMCAADRRQVNTMTLDGGWEAINFNGIPMMVDPDAIDGEIYFLTSRDLQIFRMSDYAWMEKDGSVLSRVSGYDAYEAVLFRYAEFGCFRRHTHGVLTDIYYED